MSAARKELRETPQVTLRQASTHETRPAADGPQPTIPQSPSDTAEPARDASRRGESQPESRFPLQLLQFEPARRRRQARAVGPDETDHAAAGHATSVGAAPEPAAEVQAELRRLRNALHIRMAVGNHARKQQQVLANALREVRQELQLRTFENEQARLRNVALESEIEQCRGAMHTRSAHDVEQRRRLDLLLRELEMLRTSKLLRWRNRILDRTNRWTSLPAAFQQLKDDNLIFGHAKRGYHLQPSVNLARLPYIEYRIELCRARLTGLLLAPLLDVPLRHGELRIELMADERILARAAVPGCDINDCTPAQFRFDPVAIYQNSRYRLRVAARRVDAPLRLLEWRKWRFLGLGSLQTRLFCGFVHENKH